MIKMNLRSELHQLLKPLLMGEKKHYICTHATLFCEKGGVPQYVLHLEEQIEDVIQFMDSRKDELSYFTIHKLGKNIYSRYLE